MLRCWYRTHRLPDSVSFVSMLRDSRSQAYVTRLSLPKPFGLRVANLMAELSIDPTRVYSFQLPRRHMTLAVAALYVKSIHPSILLAVQEFTAGAT
ncbi:hypothetical protein E2C01_080750 [Portunus trituberculatus]|uniref:Uncharacterized protein n=1 Tax=Portunus trituberculatus TaxID=210409 RepID=A0A5B7J0F0_PORTR|nr:hypothetical protein [Portunus trituberculatus]